MKDKQPQKEAVQRAEVSSALRMLAWVTDYATGNRIQKGKIRFRRCGQSWEVSIQRVGHSRSKQIRQKRQTSHRQSAKNPSHLPAVR